MPRLPESIEFATPTLKDAEAMWYLEGVSWLSQVELQKHTNEHTNGVTDEVMKICLDETILTAPEDYAIRLEDRLNSGKAYLLNAYSRETGDLTAMLDVTLSQRGIPYHQVAALHGEGRFGGVSKKHVILASLLRLFNEEVGDTVPIHSTVFGWQNDNYARIYSPMLRIFNGNGYARPNQGADIKLQGCLKATRLIREGGVI